MFTFWVSTMTSFAILAIFPLCMVFATLSDLLTMKIPNKVIMVMLVGFVVLAPLAGMSLTTAGWSLGVALVVLAIGFALFCFGVMGGGDAKLLAVTSLWLGTAHSPLYLIYGGLLGGALTLLILALRRNPMPMFMYKIGWIDRLHDTREGVPYGAALGPAAMLVFPDSPWMDFAVRGLPIG